MKKFSSYLLAYFLVTLVLIGFTNVAAAAGSITVYSQRSPDLLNPFLESFTKESGIEVKVLYVSSGLFARLAAEKNTTPADAVLTKDGIVLVDLQRAGLLRPLKSDYAMKVVPMRFRGKNDQWYGITKRARIVYADRNLQEFPQSIEELADPKWRGEICMRPAAHAYNLTLFSAYAAHFGDKRLLKFLRGLKANLARPPQGNDRAQAKAIWQKECKLGLGNSYYLGLMAADAEQKAWVESLRPLFLPFSESEKGVHVNVAGLGFVKQSKKEKQVKQLLEFLLREDVQVRYAAQNYEYAVHNGINASTKTAGDKFADDDIPLRKIAAKRAKTLEIIDSLRFDE